MALARSARERRPLHRYRKDAARRQARLASGDEQGAPDPSDADFARVRTGSALEVAELMAGVGRFRIGRIRLGAARGAVSELAMSRALIKIEPTPAFVIARLFALTAPAWLPMSGSAHVIAGNHVIANMAIRKRSPSVSDEKCNRQLVAGAGLPRGPSLAIPTDAHLTQRRARRAPLGSRTAAAGVPRRGVVRGIRVTLAFRA